MLAVTDLAAQLETVDARHLDVRHHDTGLDLETQFPGFVAILRLEHVVTIQLEQRSEHDPDVAIIVGDEHRRDVIGGDASRKTAQDLPLHFIPTEF